MRSVWLPCSDLISQLIGKAGPDSGLDSRLDWTFFLEGNISIYIFFLPGGGGGIFLLGKG